MKIKVNSEFITIVNSHIVYNKLGKSTSLASNTLPSESDILICSPPVATLIGKDYQALIGTLIVLVRVWQTKKIGRGKFLPSSISSVIQVHFPI